MARPRRVASRLTGFTEEMARRGLLAESQTLLARREQAGPGVARALSLTEGDAVIHWRRLRRADGVPMCIEDAYLNEVLIPGFLQSGMPTSLYDALEARGLRPTWAEDSITADVATEEEAAAARDRARRRRAAPLAPRAGGGEGRRGVALGLPRRPVHHVGPARRRRAEPALEQPAQLGATGVAGLLAHPHRVGPPRSGWM